LRRGGGGVCLLLSLFFLSFFSCAGGRRGKRRRQSPLPWCCTPPPRGSACVPGVLLCCTPARVREPTSGQNVSTICVALIPYMVRQIFLLMCKKILYDNYIAKLFRGEILCKDKRRDAEQNQSVKAVGSHFLLNPRVCIPIANCNHDIVSHKNNTSAPH
jgi:hypothetical protein